MTNTPVIYSPLIHLVLDNKQDEISSKLENYLVKKLQENSNLVFSRILNKDTGHNVLQIQCTNKRLLNRANSQGLLKRCRNGTFRPFKTVQMESFEVPNLSPPGCLPFTTFEANSLLLAELSSIICDEAVPYHSFKDLGLLQLCVGMGVVTVWFPEEPSQSRDADFKNQKDMFSLIDRLGPGFTFLYVLKHQLYRSMLRIAFAIITLETMSALCDCYLPLYCLPSSCVPSIMLLWCMACPTTALRETSLSGSVSFSSGHFLKPVPFDLTSNLPSISSHTLQSSVYSTISDPLHKTLELAKHERIKNVFGSQRRSSSIIQNSIMSLLNISFLVFPIMLVSVISICFAFVGRHPLRSAALFRFAISKISDQNSWADTLNVLGQIKLSDIPPDFEFCFRGRTLYAAFITRSIQIILFSLVLALSHLICRRLTRTVYNGSGPLEPRSIALRILPWIIFGMLWVRQSTPLTTLIEIGFGTPNTDIISTSEIEILPRISPTDFFISLQNCWWPPAGLLNSFVEFLCVKLDPFEMFCLFHSATLFIPKQNRSMNSLQAVHPLNIEKYLLTLSFPILLKILLLTLSLHHPYLLMILVVHLFLFNSNCVSLSSIRAYYPLDMLKLGHGQSISPISAYPLISSISKADQLLQFILSLHLVIYICIALLVLSLFSSWHASVQSAILLGMSVNCFIVATSTPVIPSLMLVPKREKNYPKEVKSIEPAAERERLEKTAVLLLQPPELPLPRLTEETGPRLSMKKRKSAAAEDPMVFLNRFLGTWKLIRDRSDPMEEVSKAMGIKWAVRKAIEQFDPRCSYNRNGNTLTIKQLLPLNITKNVVLHIDGNDYQDNDGDIGAWITNTVGNINEMTIISKRKRASDGLFLVETRKILTEKWLSRCQPDVNSDVLFYFVDVMPSGVNGAVVASSKRLFAREEGPPAGVLMPWDVITSTTGVPSALSDDSISLSSLDQERTEIPVIKSLDELVLVEEVPFKVKQENFRNVLLESLSTTTLFCPIPGQPRSLVRLAFEAEYRSNEWQDEEMQILCSKSIQDLIEANVDMRLLQEAYCHSQTVAREVVALACTEDPSKLQLHFETGNWAGAKQWKLIKMENNMKIDIMKFNTIPSICRASLIIKTTASVVEVTKFLSNPGWPIGIDPHVDRAFKMYQVNPDVVLGYEAVKGILGGTGQDTVFISSRLLSSDRNWGCVSATTISIPQIEAAFKDKFCAKYVRVDLIRSGMEVRKLPEGLRLTYINQIDSKISNLVPEKVVDQIKIFHLRRIQLIKDYIEVKFGKDVLSSVKQK